MIREKELEPLLNSARLDDNDATSMEAFLAIVTELSDKYGAQVAYKEEEISRSFLSSTLTPCVVLYHSEHPDDYYNYCIVRKVQGSTCVYQVSMYGSSRQMGKEAFQENTKIFDGSGSRGTAVGALRGGAVGAGFALGSAAVGITKGGIKLIAKGINALTMDKEALAAEKEWYAMMGEIIGAALS